jgi:hypothetical protein
MPLPLPNLDTRRWEDLVAEGRALIPRYAPDWTDHNVHDPGIMLMEFLAWQVEQAIYRANRVPARHRRKFLALAGYAPRPPRPAQAVLTFTLTETASVQTLPLGLKLAAQDGTGRTLPFRTLAELTVHPVRIRAVQVFDGNEFSDATRFWAERQPFHLLGARPGLVQAGHRERQPAFYLGFDAPLPAGRAVSLWFWFGGPRTGLAERGRLRAEAQQRAQARQARRPGWPCTPDLPDVPRPIDLDTDAAPQALPPHHSVRTVWEYHDGNRWRPLDPGQIVDDTRGLTLDGAVRLTLPSSIESRVVGMIPRAHYYVRCRLASGRPDAAPTLRHLALNAVPVRQTGPARRTIEIPAGVTPPPGLAPVAGQCGPLRIGRDAAGQITGLAVDPDAQAPVVRVLDYRGATGNTPGQLTVTPAWVGWGTGLPGQRVVLPGAPIVAERVTVWTFENGDLRPWRQRPDLDASRRTDADVVIDATTGEVMFGDGENGRLPPRGAPILATYQVTAGATGNVAAGSGWRLAGADDAVNSVILGADLPDVVNSLASIANPCPAGGGADQEPFDAAVDRAVSALWAHERLVELCPPGQALTLDPVRDQALQLSAPERATTLLDYERLALDVPGTRVARARAWAEIAPGDPKEQPGVHVVVVPHLPRERPEPSPGLLTAVYCYLDYRRIVGTRLIVTDPNYVQVSVRASVRAKVGADPERVRQRVLAALDRFLHPLEGGPNGRGWPFGRDVYPAEILRVIDAEAGVDHVFELELVSDGGDPQRDPLSVGLTGLVTPGQHEIQVQAAERNV